MPLPRSVTANEYCPVFRTPPMPTLAVCMTPAAESIQVRAKNASITGYSALPPHRIGIGQTA